MNRPKINYKKILDLAGDAQDWCVAMKNGARPTPKIEADRIKKIAADICNVKWGIGGPQYSYFHGSVVMPVPARELDQYYLFALCHELQHARQDKDGTLVYRKWPSTPTGNVEIEWDVLVEEWRANVGALKTLLDEDMLHPKMIGYAARSFLSYVAGWVRAWAYRGWDRQKMGGPRKKVTGLDLDEAIERFKGMIGGIK